MEWKVIYVGSAESESHDQELDSVLVGPVPVGINRFVFQADPPKLSLIPHGNVLGVTAVLVTCSYNDNRFIQIGYYVNNEYNDPAMNENPPSQPQLDKIRREILADSPRVTRFPIRWDNNDTEVRGPTVDAATAAAADADAVSMDKMCDDTAATGVDNEEDEEDDTMGMEESD